MRIGIDARLVPYQRGGISTYVQELVAALGNLEPQHSYYLLQSRKGFETASAPSGAQRRTLWTPPHHRLEQWTLPVELARLPLDVLHSPDFIPPLRRRVPAVITVHDLAFLRYPDTKPAEALRYYGQVDKAVASAEGVIAVSESTKRDMVELLGAAPERIDVVHHGVDPSYRPLDDGEAVAAFCRAHGLPERFILWVSTIEPRKNLECLLEALAQAQLEERGQTLVLVGGNGWRAEEGAGLAQRLGLSARTIFYGPASRDELRLLYNAAWALVYPSWYEGFGLPPLEAMACGTPVISSTAAALQEVLGDAPLYFDPADPAALSEHLTRLQCDEALSWQLREAGLQRAALYRWEETARRTLAVYEKAAQR